MYLLEVGENLAKKNKTKNSIILETYSWKARLKSNLKEKTARTNKAVFKKKKEWVGGPLRAEGRSRALMFSFTSFLLQSDSLFLNRVPAILKKKKKNLKRILNIFKNRVCSAVHPKGC